MNISSFSGLEYPSAASQKMNGASGHQTAAAPNTAGVAPAYHQHQQYSGQYSQQPMPLPPPPPGAYGAPSAPPYAQQPYSAYGAMYGQYPYMDPATYHQYYHSQMGYQQYYQQPPLPQQQQQYAQPPPPPQAPATSVPRPPPPPAVAAPAPVAVAPTPVSAPAARALGPAPAAYAAQPSAYGQRPQRPPQLPPASAYQYGVPSSTGVPLPPPPPQHSQQQPQHQQYAATTSQTYSQQSAGTSSPAVSSNDSAESKQVEEQRNKPAEQAAPAPAPASAPTAVPFNFDLPKHKVRLNSGNRKDGWHKYLSDEDRPAVEKILREAVEFDDEFVNFEKEMQKMASATSSFGDNSLNEYNSMWENWKKNLLTRSEQMMKLMEYNLDNHYKKVCQNYPLFITKSADEHHAVNNNTSREVPAEKLPPLLPDPVAPVVSSRQQQQQPLLGQGPPLLPTPAPVPHPVQQQQQQQQQPPARSKYSNSNNKTVPLISGNASSPLLTAPPGREKAALAEPFHHDLQTTAKPVYSTDTAKAVVAPSSSIRGTFKIPGVSIHDMGKVETMLAVDETISKSIMSTINDVEFQSAHNDFSFLRHQAKFMHDVIMYQKVRPRRNLGSVYVHPHVVETTSVNVAPQKRSLIQGRPPNSGAPSAAAVPISGGGEEGGANLSLLDNALNSALKLLKESRVASTAGDDGSGSGILGSAKPAITKPRHPAGIPKSLINANQSNIIPLTSFKETKPIQVAFSSKSKYNNSLTAIDTSSPMGGDALADDVVDPLTGQKAGVSMKLQRLGPATLKSKSAKTFVLAADEEDLEELEAKGRQLLDSIPSGPARGRERGGRGGRSDRDRDRARDWERERDRGRGHDHWDRDRERERDRDRERGRDKSSRERESSSRSHSSRRDEAYDSAHHHHHRPSSSPPPPQPPLPYRSSFKSTYFEHQGNSNGSGGGNGFPPGAAAVPVGALDFSSADIESFLKQERAQLEKNSEQEEQSGPPVQRLSYTDSRFFTVPRKFTEEALTLDDLLEAPARRCRPPRIVLIIRGLPGSGKSTLARAIKEEEEAASPLAKIRLLSLDDYFVVEKACSSEDQLQLVYEYDQAKESDYKCNLFKAFRKTLLSGYGDFVIVDSVNASLTDVRHYYACAVENNFIPYVIEMEAIVRRLLDDCIAGEEIIAHCYKHNRHGRSLAEIRALYDSWELLPPEYLRVDAYSMAVKLSERGAVGPEVPRFRPKVPGGAAVSLAEQDQGQQQQQVLTVHSDYDTGDVPPSSYPPSAEAPPQSPWTVASDNGGGRPPLQQQQQERPPSPLDPRDADAFMRNKRQSPSSGGSGGGQEEYSSYGEYKRSRYGEVAPPLNMMNEPPPPPSSHEYGYAHPSYGDPSRGGQYAHPHYQDHQPPPPHPSQYMSEQEYQQYLHQQRAHGQPPPPFQDYASSYYDSQPPPPPSSNYY